MKLLIPEISSKLKLIKDWDFLLYKNYLNTKFVNILIPLGKFDKQSLCEFVTIPKDTILNVSKIYIKMGVSSQSSLTFTITKKDNKKHPLAGAKFWASLNDVNEIEFENLECNTETLQLIQDVYEDLRKNYDTSKIDSFLSIVLDGKNVNNIRPVIKPDMFLYKCVKVANKKVDINRNFNNHNKEEKLFFRNMVEYFVPLLRKFKINNILQDESRGI